MELQGELIARGSKTKVYNVGDIFVKIESRDLEKDLFYKELGIAVFNEAKNSTRVTFNTFLLKHVKKDINNEEDLVSYLEPGLELANINSIEDLKELKRSDFERVMLENFAEIFNEGDIRFIVRKYFNAMKTSILAMLKIKPDYTLRDVDIHYWQFMQIKEDSEIYCIDCMNKERAEW